MDFNLLSSLFAGFLATVMMTLATELASLRGLTSLPSVPLLLGTFVSGDHDLATAVGSAIHYLIVGTILNGAIYALALSVVGADLLLAALIGMVHGALIGVGLGWLKRIHPRVIDGAAVRGRSISAESGEVVFSDPGMFGVGWGDLTPMVVVGAYVIYSVMFAAVYSLTA